MLVPIRFACISNGGNHPMRASVRLAAAFLAACALPAMPVLADSGTLGNILDMPLTYQVGIPDAQGFVAWQSHTLQPCETHQWSWDQAGPPNLHMIYPLWQDQRRDEYGNIIMERRVVPMSPAGGLSVFFPLGEQIWVDMSGAGTMDSCLEAAVIPPPPPSGPATSPGDAVSPGLAFLLGPDKVFGLTYVSLADEIRKVTLPIMDDLVARAERGEILLIDQSGMRGGNFDIVAYSREDIVRVLLLEMLSNDTYTEDAFIDELTAFVVQSQAIAARLRTNAGTLQGPKN
jgi:hypothetical protein